MGRSLQDLDATGKNLENEPISMAENHSKENDLKPQSPAPVRREAPNPVKRTLVESACTHLPTVKLNLTKTLTVINEMRAARVIGRYAIGDAVGATFYLEPVPTMDVEEP
jgi:hypothetical protein